MLARWATDTAASPASADRTYHSMQRPVDTATLDSHKANRDDAAGSTRNKPADSSLRLLHDRWRQPDRHRLSVAVKCLMQMAFWTDKQAYTKQQQTRDAERDALKDLADRVADSLATKPTNISEDATICMQLRKAIDADAVAGQPHDRVHNSNDANNNLARKLAAVEYRMEDKKSKRALLWLLAVLAHAWGDDTVLKRVLAECKAWS